MRAALYIVGLWLAFNVLFVLVMARRAKIRGR